MVWDLLQGESIEKELQETLELLSKYSNQFPTIKLSKETYNELQKHKHYDICPRKKYEPRFIYKIRHYLFWRRFLKNNKKIKGIKPIWLK